MINGPHWLAAPLPSNQEERKYCTEEVVGVRESPITFVVNLLSRWSQFTKAIHVFTWVLIFVHNSNLRGCKILGSLSGEELDKTRTQIIYTETLETL